MSIVDKLTPHPPQVEGAEVKCTPKPALTAAESAALAKCSTWVLATLKKYGITITGEEVKWLGAEVADFVIAVTSEVATQAADVKPAPDTKA